MKKITALAAIMAAALPAFAKYDDVAPAEPDTAGGANSIHDAGLYWLKLCDTLYCGDEAGNGGFYPGGNGVETLYVGSFWVGTNAWGTPRVSGSYPYGPGGTEWYPLQGLLWSDSSNWSERPSYINKHSDLDSYLRCDDREATEQGPIGLVVEQQGEQWSDGPNDDYIIFQDFITNNSGRDLNDMYVCLYYDFDIGGSLSYVDDYVGIDYDRKMPYMYDNQGHPYVGLRVLEGSPYSVGAPTIMDDPGNDLYKWQIMTSGQWIVKNSPNDWRVCLSSGPHAVANDIKLRYAFAVVAGMSLSQLQTNADAAWDKYWYNLGVDDFSAHALPGKVELGWEPNSPYVGFNLYRAEADFPNAGVKINNNLITGHKPYRYLDSSVTPGVTYKYTLEAVTASGTRETFGLAEATALGLTKAASFALAQNAPNPARDATAITFTLTEAADCEFTIYDLSGRKVMTAGSAYYGAGEHRVAVNVKNLTPGVYVYRLRAGEAVAARKMVVTR